MCGSHAVVRCSEVKGLHSTEVFGSLLLELLLTRLDDLNAWGVPFDVLRHTDSVLLMFNSRGVRIAVQPSR